MLFTELPQTGHGLVETALVISESQTYGTQLLGDMLDFALFHEEGETLVLGSLHYSQFFTTELSYFFELNGVVNTSWDLCREEDCSIFQFEELAHLQLPDLIGSYLSSWKLSAVGAKT
jgi:hypothetical protein